MLLMNRCPRGTGRNQPGRKWRTVSAMGSGSWVRSSAPQFSFWQPSTTVTSLFSLVRSSLPRRCCWCTWHRPSITAGPILTRNLSSSNRSRGDFFVNRGNVHAICLGPVTRWWRVSDAWDRLGTRAFRRHYESNTRSAASSETCDDSLPWNVLDWTRVHPSARAGNSVVGAPLVDRRWHRLHGWHFIFRERADALWPFRLASVRACRE